MNNNFQPQMNYDGWDLFAGMTQQQIAAFSFQNQLWPVDSGINGFATQMPQINNTAVYGNGNGSTSRHSGSHHSQHPHLASTIPSANYMDQQIYSQPFNPSVNMGGWGGGGNMGGGGMLNQPQVMTPPLAISPNRSLSASPMQMLPGPMYQAQATARSDSLPAVAAPPKKSLKKRPASIATQQQAFLPTPVQSPIHSPTQSPAHSRPNSAMGGVDAPYGLPSPSPSPAPQLPSSSSRRKSSKVGENLTVPCVQCSHNRWFKDTGALSRHKKYCEKDLVKK